MPGIRARGRVCCVCCVCCTTDIHVRRDALLTRVLATRQSLVHGPRTACVRVCESLDGTSTDMDVRRTRECAAVGPRPCLLYWCVRWASESAVESAASAYDGHPCPSKRVLILPWVVSGYDGGGFGFILAISCSTSSRLRAPITVMHRLFCCHDTARRSPTCTILQFVPSQRVCVTGRLPNVTT